MLSPIASPLTPPPTPPPQMSSFLLTNQKWGGEKNDDQSRHPDKRQMTITSLTTMANDYDKTVGEYVDYSVLPALPPPPQGSQ